MTVKERIIHSSPTEIRLYKEGAFWIGYEQSAYLLTRVKQLKPSKRFVKTVGQEVVSVGFPDATLRKVFAQMMQIKKEEASMVVLESVVALNRADFEKWKQEIPLKVKESKPVVEEKTGVALEEEVKSNNLYSNLPVFKVAYELLRFVYSESGKMTRTYRFTLGENLQKAMTELLLNLYRANCDFDKARHIAHARENTEMVRLMLRVAYDEGQMNMKQYLSGNDHIESISKQLTRWGQSLQELKFKTINSLNFEH